MSALQILCIVISLGITIVGVGLLVRAVRHFVTTFKLGAPDHTRTGEKGARTVTLLREFLGHTRMSRLPVVAIAHWFTMVSFGVLFLTLVMAFGQVFDPHFVLPLIGHFVLYEWITELFAVTGLAGIVALMVIRQRSHPRSAAGDEGRRSRFFGSTFWQAYYVELTILGVALCITLLRGLEYAQYAVEGSDYASALHFPFTFWLGELFGGMSEGALGTAIIVIATIKIVISMAWMITISLTPTMGVAWHRFLAFFNIFFKRHADGRTSLGELQPMMVGGEPFSMEVMEEMGESEEEVSLGVGKVEDFTWKGLLDFSTCTECGRCQSQCPAWNTDKPLSPKLLMMTLRDHSQSKAPFVAAAREATGTIENQGPTRPQTAEGATHWGVSETTVATKEATEVETSDAIDWSGMSLVGQTGYDVEQPLTAYNPHGPDAVIDEDVLWSCTTCGACVEQCPVDIEHVDHIVDMRRYQNLIESAFPSELGGLFKKLESKGNPWGMGAKARMDWAKDLPFTIKVLGEDVESADEVDYLFWVGCAGAYEDRAKKTTRAIAELLDHAGVDFAVLGNGETCTGDSARRAGNEVLFQMLAEQNVETLNEVGATKIVVTCAHCFNTIKNEYPQLGGHYEVLHHTQLLNRLVREKKIVPVNRPDGPRKSTLKDVASTSGTVTYHDPCYLGRHNNVYTPPRELIGALPGVELREMERTKEKSFCCGAGGARMWMEEQLGSRINLNRTDEAIATGADRIAVGCPFCRVMLTDGLTAKQSEGASEDIEVVDVAQMLLASVKEAEVKEEKPAPSGEPAPAAAAAAPAATETEAKAGQPAPSTEEPSTAADANAAPSWEDDASANAAPSWETGGAAAGAGAAGAGAAAASTTADENAAPSWESDAGAANAAPSWEDESPAPAATQAQGDDAASANAAPSWESDAGAANAAPSWEDESPAPAAKEAPAQSDDAASANAAPDWETDAGAQNAAPSWEDNSPTPAATEAPVPSSDAASANAAPDWETDTAAQNAAPDWESGSPAPAAPADEPSSEASAPSEPAPEQPAPAAAADDSVAAQNAAPSWETGAPAAPAAAAEDAEPEASSDETAQADEPAAAASADSDDDDSEVASEEPAPQPSAASDDLAAQNAAPSWETGGPAAAAPAPEATPAEEAPAEPEPAAAESETVEAEPAEPQGGAATDTDAETPTDEPAAEAESEETEKPATPETASTQPERPSTSHPAPEGVDIDDLANKNAAPDWE
ncbi:(Fe-S)-binding protein [Janibacter alkaliphilus]|uniref:Fe-S oxidoreductase n=1 Tax=Janibacter alkaliphilus TaxID=1069963 RepID=A0A852X5S9_9MICO|nr:Fe-S oxidoreductase [Janibacter alkaliphilus]